MVKQKTREEREVKKCFQSYFTTLLYQFLDGSINQDIHNEIKNLWMRVCKDLYKNFKILDVLQLDPQLLRHEYEYNVDSNKNIVKIMWNRFLRFYLKGGKATLRAVDNYLQTEKGIQNQIAQIFYDELKRTTLDSDWDFCLALHSSLLDNKWIIELIDSFLKTNLDNIKQRLYQNWTQRISLFQDYVNDIKNQQKFLVKEIKNSISLLNTLIENSSSETKKQTALNQRKELTELLDSIEYNIPILFSYKKENPFHTLFLNVDKKEITMYGIERELFKLYRVIFSFEQQYTVKGNQVNSVFPSKMFGELIDISLSLSPEVNNDLFKKSNLSQMINPIRYIEFYPETQDYPIAGLAYQLKDNIVILSELNPSKPLKRIHRFIEQLKIYCLKQEVPELPHSIHISKNMILKLMEEPEFESIFNVSDLPSKDIIKSNEQLFYEVHIKENLKQMKNFEQWCTEQQIPWFDINETKDDIIELIESLLKDNELSNISKHSLIKFSKKQLFSLKQELDILFKAKELFTEYKKHLNTIFSSPSYVQNFEERFNNIIYIYFTDINMVNKNNYGIIEKPSLISSFEHYTLDNVFLDFIKKLSNGTLSY